MGKGVHSCEYMDDWEKFNETWLPEKEDFYSHLNMEDVVGADRTHAKSIGNIKFRRISWFVCSKQCIIVS